MDRNRILIVTEALEMNGVLRSLLDFMEAMDKERYEIDLFCFDAFQPAFVKLPSYVHVLPEDPWCYMARAPLARIVGWAMRHLAVVPLCRRLLVSAFQKHFPRWFVKQDLAKRARRMAERYDVACAYSMGMTWRFVAEKVVARKKLMWLDTDIHYEPWASFWRKYSPCLAEAAALVCVGEGIAAGVRAEHGEIGSMVKVIHNVVNADVILEQGKAALEFPKNGRFRIVTVGRYCHPKNQVMIPLVANELRRRGFADFEWIMAGTGSHLYRTEDPNLIYLDALMNPMPLMKSADLYVQPSIYEGWGLSLTEAMVLGRYVIASDIPAFREQVLDDKEGLLVPCSPEPFAEAIMKFVHNPVVVDASSILQRFGFDTVRKEFENVLGE